MPIILVIDTKCILIMKIMQTKREETKLLQLVKPPFCHLLLCVNTNSILLFTLGKKTLFLLSDNRLSNKFGLAHEKFTVLPSSSSQAAEKQKKTIILSSGPRQTK